MRCARLIPLLAASFAGSLSAQVDVGPFDLPAGSEVTIEIDVLVADPLGNPATDLSVCTQGTVSGAGFADVTTDDPRIAGSSDATCTSFADYGDAPTTASYPQDAVHTITSGLRLGSRLDADAGAQGTPVADGDDTDGNDDDDGVLFGEIRRNSPVTVDVTVSGACFLNAWIDWNNNGDWADPGEQIFTDESLSPGVNNLGFMAPMSIFVGATYSRFRCSTVPGLGPGGTGGATPDGEVEDYELTTLVPVELLSFEVR